MCYYNSYGAINFKQNCKQFEKHSVVNENTTITINVL